jgi:hypothetical protein
LFGCCVEEIDFNQVNLRNNVLIDLGTKKSFKENIHIMSIVDAKNVMNTISDINEN